LDRPYGCGRDDVHGDAAVASAHFSTDVPTPLVRVEVVVAAQPAIMVAARKTRRVRIPSPMS
jgi:hypothetical protein